jgi:hypothetical protein
VAAAAAAAVSAASASVGGGVGSLGTTSATPAGTEARHRATPAGSVAALISPGENAAAGQDARTPTRESGAAGDIAVLYGLAIIP